MKGNKLDKIEGYSLEDRKVKCGYCALYCDQNALYPESLIGPLTDPRQDNFEAFLVGTGASLSANHHYEVLSKIIENPRVLGEPNLPPTYQYIKDNHIEVLITIALGVEANMMFIKPGEQLFHFDPSEKLSGNEERVKLAKKLTGPSPERIQQIFADFRPYMTPNYDMPKGNITSVLPKMMKRIGIRIKAAHDRKVILYFREFLDSYAIHRMVETVEFSHVVPSVPLREMTGPLVPREYGVIHSASFVHPAIPSYYESRHSRLSDNPISDRKFKYHDAMGNLTTHFRIFNEPTNPNEVTRQLERAGRGGGGGANMDAAELDEEADDLSDGGDMGDYYDGMDYPVDDGDVPMYDPEQPGRDMMAGPNERQPPAPNPNPNRVAGAPPNTEHPNARAANGDRTHTEHNLPGAPTARKRGANEARRYDSSAPKRNRTSSDARRAKLKKKRAKKSRRRSKYGRRANTRGENGYTDIHESPFFAALKEFLRHEFDTLNKNDAARFDALNANVSELNTNAAARLNALNNNAATRLNAIDINIGALRAESMNNRANHFQRGTEAGPQTNARAEGGDTDALGAGAIPRPVIAPDNGQAEGEDEVQAETEIAKGSHKYKWRTVFLIFIVIALFFISRSKAPQTDDVDAIPSPDIQPPRNYSEDGIEAAFCQEEMLVEATDDIDVSASPDIQKPSIKCDDGIEAATAFCQGDNECVREVRAFCLIHKETWPNVYEESFKPLEDLIIAKFM